jgi:hypothetical protein
LELLNGGTAKFAADETIRRKATVTPTTTFNKTNGIHLHQILVTI